MCDRGSIDSPSEIQAVSDENRRWPASCISEDLQQAGTRTRAENDRIAGLQSISRRSSGHGVCDTGLSLM
jgi:hypothetical protein